MLETQTALVRLQVEEDRKLKRDKTKEKLNNKKLEKEKAGNRENQTA